MADRPERTRLDAAMVARDLAASRDRAKALIMSGRVRVNDQIVDKAGSRVLPDDRITLKGDDIPFVSRGGLKLAAALAKIDLNLTDTVCMDIGASTGGFTDCLLQHGARKVYAVDVGYGQLAWQLRQDSRVIVLERTNIRHLPYETIGCPMDIVAIDTSFISLKTVVPSAEKFMRSDTRVLALIKPQFEAGRSRIGKNGVVRDQQTREQVVNELDTFFQARGYETGPVVWSPVAGPKGNLECIIPLTFLGKT